MDRRRERRERRWKPGPLVVSLLLHGAVVGLLALSTDPAPAPPKTKVYAVDIVSPPPNVAGAPPMEALSNQEPGPAAAPAPAPAAEPAPPAAEPTPPAAQPDPPAPDPEPAPPKAEAPKEPAKAPEPRRTPPQRPPQPVQRPSTPATRPNTPDRPAATPEKSRPSTTRPPATPEKDRPSTTRPSTTGSSPTGGTGSGPNRTRGDGTSTAPATGSNPQPNSPGGEGINIHSEGEPCPVAGYCERVTIQVQRYFRPPPGNASARGEVCFRIQRDGAVTDIQTRGLRGGAGAAFRLAMMEAAEAAGSRQAFGALPSAFDPQRWRWCVELSPR